MGTCKGRVVCICPHFTAIAKSEALAVAPLHTSITRRSDTKRAKGERVAEVDEVEEEVEVEMTEEGGGVGEEEDEEEADEGGSVARGGSLVLSGELLNGVGWGL